MGKLYVALSVPVLAAWIFYRFFAGPNPEWLKDPNFLSLPFPFWSTVLFALFLALLLEGVFSMGRRKG